MDKLELMEHLYTYRKYVKDLMKIMGVDADNIDDLVSDIFLSAYENIDKLREPEKMKNWIRAIANNRARKYFREKSRRREICNMVRVEMGEEFFDVYDTVADEEAYVEKILQKAEDMAEGKKIVDELLASLTDINKRIIFLRIWEDYKFTEIADVLNLNLNTVKSIYRRSLKQLKNNYHKRFGKEDYYG